MAPWWLRESDDEVRGDETPETMIPATPEAERATAPEWAAAPERATAPERAAPERAAPERTEPSDELSGEAAASGPRRRKRRRKRRRPAAEAPEPAKAPRERPSPPPVAYSAPEIPSRGLVFSPPEAVAASDELRIAMLCDLENIALGVRDSKIKQLDVNLILERLLEKGKVMVKKAYADWERYSEFKRPFHEAAIELIDIPQKYYSGKNSADIKMVVDAMDLCYSKEHLDTFAVVSGDSDFSPLVSKLKENNKYVIGIGVRDSSSNLLIDNCDEFIFYEDVWRAAHQGPRLDHLSPQQAEVFGLMSDAMLALIRESKDVLWGSMIKQTMKRKRPSFNESTYGYGSFSELLEEAQRLGIISLKRDERSGSYVVTGFAK